MIRISSPGKASQGNFFICSELTLVTYWNRWSKYQNVFLSFKMSCLTKAGVCCKNLSVFLRKKFSMIIVKILMIFVKILIFLGKILRFILRSREISTNLCPFPLKTRASQRPNWEKRLLSFSTLNGLLTVNMIIFWKINFIH